MIIYKNISNKEMTKNITNNAEIFSKSNCDCLFCLQTHLSIREWDSFTPKTNLQHRMINVVDKIVKRENTRTKHKR